MIDRFREIARALVAVLLLGIAGAGAQTAQSQTSPNHTVGGIISEDVQLRIPRQL